MNVELVNADDDNEGFVFGLQGLDDEGCYNDYVEWFKTEEERDSIIMEFNMNVVVELSDLDNVCHNIYGEVIAE